MSKKSKICLIRRALIAGFFSAEFTLAFLGIVTGCMSAYAFAAVAGCVVPAFYGVR